MKFLPTLLVAALTAAGGATFAQDTMKKDAMKDGAMDKPMTMQQCKDHMAMKHGDMKKDDAMAKKDDAMMKKDAQCADMMKKDSMKNDAMTKKDGMAPDPMKK